MTRESDRYSVQYQTALVHLLQPLLHLDHADGSYDHLRTLVIRQASEGFALITQHRNLYTSLYQSPLQLFCMVHICDALVRYHSESPSIPETIQFCFESLQEAKVSYPIAGPLQQMFRLSLAEYNVPVPDHLKSLIGDSSQYGPEDFLNTCTRATYRQPIKQLLSNLDPALGIEFVQELQRMDQEGFRASQEYQASRASQESQQSQQSRRSFSQSTDSEKIGLMRIDSLLNS